MCTFPRIYTFIRSLLATVGCQCSLPAPPMSRVWGVVNTLVCNRCGQLFQCRHLRQHCRCHPLSPTPGLEGSSGLVYPCCGRRQQPFRLLDTPPVRGACGWREQCGHTVAETAISVHENTCVWAELSIESVVDCSSVQRPHSSEIQEYNGHTRLLCSITSSLSHLPGWLSAKRPLCHCCEWCSWYK